MTVLPDDWSLVTSRAPAPSTSVHLPPVQGKRVRAPDESAAKPSGAKLQPSVSFVVCALHMLHMDAVRKCFLSLAFIFIVFLITPRFRTFEGSPHSSTDLTESSRLSRQDRSFFVNGKSPFIDSPLDCVWIEEFGDSDFANWAALSTLCASKFRAQMRAQVMPTFRDRFVNLSNGTGILSEAYVLFLSGPIQYTDLAQWALVAATEFSSKPILAFMSGAAISVAAERFPASTFPTLVIFEVPAPTLNPWFDKLRAILLSPVLNGVIIEADTIITHHADRLFRLAGTHALQFPLLPIHPDERLPSCSNYKGSRTCENPIDFPIELRSTPYSHAHVIWNAQSKPFLSRTLYRCIQGGEKSEMCDSDEAALNFQLWQEKATKYLCMMDPNEQFVDMWQKLASMPTSVEHLNYVMVFIHGHKNPAHAEKIVNQIRTMGRERPWIYFNRTWLNATDENLRLSSEGYGCII